MPLVLDATRVSGTCVAFVSKFLGLNHFQKVGRPFDSHQLLERPQGPSTSLSYRSNIKKNLLEAQ